MTELVNQLQVTFSNIVLHMIFVLLRMDSYVLAETFKYLFLLFAEEDELLLDMDDFVFTTEAHLFPLSLAYYNTTLNQVVQDAVSDVCLCVGVTVCGG